MFPSTVSLINSTLISEPMKKLISIVLTGLAVLSCSKTQEKEVLSIYYPEIVNIGPSMHFVSDPPSYAGVRPEEFSITQVTLDGSPLSEHPFSINAKNCKSISKDRVKYSNKKREDRGT